MDHYNSVYTSSPLAVGVPSNAWNYQFSHGNNATQNGCPAGTFLFEPGENRVFKNVLGNFQNPADLVTLYPEIEQFIPEKGANRNRDLEGAGVQCLPCPMGTYHNGPNTKNGCKIATVDCDDVYCPWNFDRYDVYEGQTNDWEAQFSWNPHNSKFSNVLTELRTETNYRPSAAPTISMSNIKITDCLFF